MKKKSCPIIEVGKNDTVVVTRNGRHMNVIVRPTKEVLKGAARLAELQYGRASQTYKSIACRI